MDYELIPIEAKVSNKSHILMGTIVSTWERDIKTAVQGDDKWVIKANVEIDDYGLVENVPVFYHCQFSEKAGKAAFSGVADGLITEGSPFVKDDRVAVLNVGDVDDLLAENLKIVAYEDGLPRQCVFQFRITRDDGVVIDESLLSQILIHQSVGSTTEVVGYTRGYHPIEDPEDAPFWVKEGDTWHYSRETSPGYLSEGSYNTATQIWTVPFVTWPDKESKYGKDFWASFVCRDSVGCQYVDREIDSRGYIYIENDFYQESHKIVSKFYEAVVPYYEEVSRYRTPQPSGCVLGPEQHWGWSSMGGIDSVIVKSSIPYTVRFKVPSVVSGCATGCYTGVWIKYCKFYPPDCDACLAAAISKGIRDCWWNEDWHLIDESENVTYTCSEGTSGSQFDVEQIITPPENTVQTDEHFINLSYHGSGTFILSRECFGGGTIDFPLNFKCFNADVSVGHSPNT